MENKTKIYLAISAVVVAFVAALLVYQQMSINSLKKEIGDLKKGSAGTLGGQPVNSSYTVASKKKMLTENVHDISGVITAMTVNSISVEGQVVNIDKLSETEEEILVGNENGYPKMKKNFLVSVNEKTEFPSIKFQDMSVGMKVRVEANELVYNTNSLTAQKIISLDAIGAAGKDFLAGQKKITGMVKEINGDYMNMEVHWFDYSKIPDPKNFDHQTAPTIIKTYKVLFDESTVYLGNKNEIQVGSTASAYSDKPTFQVSEFRATKIEGPIKL